MLDRNKLILEFWDRSKELTIKNKKYGNFSTKFLYFLLKQDIGKSDITTNSLISKNKKIFAEIIAKEDGIFAGFEEFALLNKDLEIRTLKKDGDEIKKGEVLVELNGNAKKILERERVSLNILQRMSGIATLTNELVKLLNKKVKIVATRKTLWGEIDKKAVSIGGGLTHRLNLNDSILIKDNHLKILQCNIEKALHLAKNKARFVEIEVENKEQALTAALTIKKFSNNKNIFAIMLDKINPKEIKGIIEDFKNQHLYEQILFEASGNINPNNLIEYADCGVDVISMGYITNSTKALDISLEIR